MTAIEPQRESDGSLVHVVNALLDKGLVINADIMVSVAGVELLGIRIRAALSSFDTAAQYGLEFPAGTDTSTAAWQQAQVRTETCPACNKRVPVDELLHDSCPWCGWQSARTLASRRGTGQLTTPVGDGGEHGGADRQVGGDRAPDPALTNGVPRPEARAQRIHLESSDPESTPEDTERDHGSLQVIAEPDLESYTKAELQAELRERGLPVSGSKRELIERHRSAG